jgi:hypothetical protein
MTRTKQFAVILAVVVGFFLLSIILPFAALLLFPPAHGLGAVSIGISEALVETFVFLGVVFVSWRVWVFARRFRAKA